MEIIIMSNLNNSPQNKHKTRTSIYTKLTKVPNKAAIYARVSSEEDIQNPKRQVIDLQAFASGAGLTVVRVFTEKASGTQDERPVLAECLDWCCDGNADFLLLSEISCLGRTARIIIDTVDRLTKAGVCIHFQDLNIDTLLPSGEENTYAMTLVKMLGLGAQMERSLILGRLNSGRKRAMENGVAMGRKPGYRKPREQKKKEYADVITLLKKGVSIRKTAQLCKVSPKTVQSIKKEFIK